MGSFGRTGMSVIGAETTLNLPACPEIGNRAVAGDPRRLRPLPSRLRGDHAPGPRAVRAARLARRAGRRHRAARALPHPRRRRRGRRARHPAGRGHGAHAVGGDAGAPRGGAATPRRRRAGADVLQFGHPADVQHRRRGRRDRISRARRRPARSGRAAAVRQRPRGRGRRASWSAASSSASPWSVPYASLDRDADARGPAHHRDARRHAGAGGPIDVDIIRSVFYRNKGAYLVGRVRRGGTTLPLVLPLLHAERGIVVDAVLMTPNEASVVFGFSWSYFRVDVPRPRELVDFLRLDHAAQAHRRALQRHRLQQARQDRAVPEPAWRTCRTPTPGSPSPRATRAW